MTNHFPSTKERESASGGPLFATPFVWTLTTPVGVVLPKPQPNIKLRNEIKIWIGNCYVTRWFFFIVVRQQTRVVLRQSVGEVTSPFFGSWIFRSVEQGIQGRWTSILCHSLTEEISFGADNLVWKGNQRIEKKLFLIFKPFINCIPNWSFKMQV